MNTRSSRSSRIYTLADVVRYRTRFDTGGWDSRNDCEADFLKSLGDRGPLYPLWRRRKFPVRSLRSFYWDVDEGDSDSDAAERINAYVVRRRAGGRFPPIIVIPSQNRPFDGNHRLRAAQIVGDAEIDAFVPVI